MDRSRRRPGVLILAAAAGALSFAAAGAPPLKALRWLPPGASPTVLARRPAECLAIPADAEEGYRVELGRAAFRTPLLLGGQAARAGMTCESCHRGGRSNPDFDFPGVSGAPGTADVTSSLFSSHRGDGVDNPKPIPDLGGPRDKLKVSQARDGRALETFIHGLVTQEFDGAEPPSAVLDGLAAYVRALSPAACPAARDAPVTAAGDLKDATRAAAAGLAALSRGDPASATLMVQAARSQLGQVSERYSGSALARERLALAASDAELAAILGLVRTHDADAGPRLFAWLVMPKGWEPLARREKVSLYARAKLAALGPIPPRAGPAPSTAPPPSRP